LACCVGNVSENVDAAVIGSPGGKRSAIEEVGMEKTPRQFCGRVIVDSFYSEPWVAHGLKGVTEALMVFCGLANNAVDVAGGSSSAPQNSGASSDDHVLDPTRIEFGEDLDLVESAEPVALVAHCARRP
jgi:hypothetical protein